VNTGTSCTRGRQIAELKARARQAEGETRALDDLPGAGAPRASRSSHLRLVYVATQVPAAPVSFAGWLAFLGLTRRPGETVGGQAATSIR
jgi:hypothetical protein